jgi:sulfhydrogenase subunit beta (sulfur reductase)
MTIPRTIRKNHIDAFLEQLGIPVAIPVHLNGTSDIDFRLADGITGIAERAERYVNSAISPLKFAYPQTQVLWRYRRKPEVQFTPLPDPGAMAIFGIRSCDVTAFRYLQHFFSRPPEDDLFRRAAERILMISVSCPDPGEKCFCVCCDGGPFLESGYDIQLTDLGDTYLFEVGSKKGESAATKGDRFLAPAPDAIIEQKQALFDAALKKFAVSSHMATGIRKLTARKAPEALWERLAARCAECGGCSFVCPMCTCFDVSDQRETVDTGRRERCWDCCQYSGYSREASGYNPRAEKVNRFKRRFTHKLSYYYVQADSRHGCVGCGRCVQACFGRVDMPGVVNALRTETIA